MKKIALLLVCLIISFPFAAFAGENIIGIWSAMTRTKGGLGSQWTFLEGGEVSYTFGALVDFKYEIENDKLNMQLIESEAVSEDKIKQQFVINGDTLAISAEGSEKPQVMTWAGIPAEKKNHPIVGNWTYEHYTGQPALMRYTSHDLAQLTVPFIVENGTYSISDDKITIKFRDQKQSAYKYKLNGKQLTLQENDSGKTTEFKLLEY